MSERTAGGEPASRLLESYPEAALLVSGDGTVIATNPKGVTFATLLRHGAAPEVPAMVQRSADAGIVSAGTVALNGTRGTVVLEVSVVPGVMGDNLVVLVRDVTMERNLRAALVASRQRYKDLAEVSADFVWEVGADGTFSFVSPTGSLGFASAELMGHHPDEILVAAEGGSRSPFVSEEPVRDREMTVRRADGSTARVAVSCRPILSETNEWQGNRGVWRELAEDRDRR